MTAEDKQAQAWSQGIRRLGLAAVQLRHAGEAFQVWEAEREGQGRGHISGAIDTMLGGIEQAIDSLADHLTTMAEGPLADVILKAVRDHVAAVLRDEEAKWRNYPNTVEVAIDNLRASLLGTTEEATDRG